MKHILLLFLVFLFPSRSLAVDSEYSDQLVARSRELHLDEDPDWLRLVHYKTHWAVPMLHSLVDDGEFFLSPAGVWDPRAELEATLRAFFSEYQETLPEAPEKQHPQCAFPARYFWLNQKLRFDSAKLPEQPCRRFREWHDALNPAGVTVIYPAAYLNNPASMFGHSLIRIDAKDQTEETRLLAYGASYAAATAERSGLIFAVRGLFGGYKGVFSISPYYKQVTKYSDLENRDIWEYQLDLNQDEVEQLVRHLWELGSTYFDYFFLDENCAYHLLSLLEAARPSLNLTDKFYWWAIPSDTVRAIAETPGLVKGTVFRPATSTKIRDKATQIEERSRELVLALSKGELSADDSKLQELSATDRAQVLELAFEYLEYRRITGKETNEVSAGRGQSLLAARSRITEKVPDLPTLPPPARPEEGHRTTRGSIGGGYSDKLAYSELEYRPAYHDLLDPQPGYVTGAELEFFDFRLRHYEGDNIKLQRLRPLSIVSLSPRDAFFQPLSWKAGMGMEREPTPGKSRGTPTYSIDGASGLTFQLAPNIALSTLLAGALKYNFDFDDRYAIGGGPQLELVYHANEQFAFGLKAESLHFLLGEEYRAQAVEVSQRTKISENLGFRFGLGHQILHGDYRNEIQGSLQLYF